MTSTKHEQPPSVASRTGNNPHFAALGGSRGVARLADHFFRHLGEDDGAIGLRELHAQDLTPFKSAFLRFLEQWLGGPAQYSEDPHRPRLRRQHLRFAIGPDEVRAWMSCMDQALAEVVVEEGLRKELSEAFSAAAEFLRNDPAHVHHHHSPREPSS